MRDVSVIGCSSLHSGLQTNTHKVAHANIFACKTEFIQFMKQKTKDIVRDNRVMDLEQLGILGDLVANSTSLLSVTLFPT